jgi:hypothetical protein
MLEDAVSNILLAESEVIDAVFDSTNVVVVVGAAAE